MPTFSCPKCKKVLKTSAALAPGKKIKCPGCATVFAPPAEDDEATAVQAAPPAVKPVRKPAPPPPDDDDEVEAPRRVPAKARARDDADEDSEDSDDRPAQRGKKKAGSKGLLLIRGGVGALLVIFAVTAFVWPGFLTGSGGKKGGNNPVGQGPDPL